MAKAQQTRAHAEPSSDEQRPGSTRQPVSFRFRAGLRDRVRGKAAFEGKSLNEMVNDLVERGLEADRAVSSIYGSESGFAVARALLATAEAAVVKHGADHGLWLYEAENFDRAAAAMRQMLENLRPVPEAQEALAEVEAARQKHLRLAKGDGPNG